MPPCPSQYPLEKEPPLGKVRRSASPSSTLLAFLYQTSWYIVHCFFHRPKPHWPATKRPHWLWGPRTRCDWSLLHTEVLGLSFGPGQKQRSPVWLARGWWLLSSPGSHRCRHCRGFRRPLMSRAYPPECEYWLSGTWSCDCFCTSELITLVQLSRWTFRSGPDFNLSSCVRHRDDLHISVNKFGFFFFFCVIW